MSLRLLGVALPPPDQVEAWATVGGAVVTATGIIVALVVSIRDGRRADAGLRRQYEEQRERERRTFLIRQLQEVGDLYAESIGTQDNNQRQVASQRLLTRLPAIPSRYATLLKKKTLGDLDSDSAAESARRMYTEDIRGVEHIDNVKIYKELAENIQELLLSTE